MEICCMGEQSLYYYGFVEVAYLVLAQYRMTLAWQLGRGNPTLS